MLNQGSGAFGAHGCFPAVLRQFVKGIQDHLAGFFDRFAFGDGARHFGDERSKSTFFGRLEHDGQLVFHNSISIYQKFEPP